MKVLFRILPVLFAFGTSSVMGQQAYLHFGTGFGFRNASAPLEGYYNNTLGQSSYTESQILMSLGGGTSVEGAIVLYGGDYFGFSLKYNHLFSQKTRSLEISNVSVATKELRNTLSGNFSRIEPSLILRGEGSLLVPYMQFGPVISFGKATWSQVEDLGTAKNTTVWEYTGGTSAGVSAACGFTYELGGVAFLFLEANAYSMSWAPEKKTMIEAKVSGKSILESLPVKVKNVEYVDERTFNYGVPTPDNEPDIHLKMTLPMSAVGIKVGLRLQL